MLEWRKAADGSLMDTMTHTLREYCALCVYDEWYHKQLIWLSLTDSRCLQISASPAPVSLICQHIMSQYFSSSYNPSCLKSTFINTSHHITYYKLSPKFKLMERIWLLSSTLKAWWSWSDQFTQDKLKIIINKHIEIWAVWSQCAWPRGMSVGMCVWPLYLWEVCLMVRWQLVSIPLYNQQSYILIETSASAVNQSATSEDSCVNSG